MNTILQGLISALFLCSLFVRAEDGVTSLQVRDFETYGQAVRRFRSVHPESFGVAPYELVLEGFATASDYLESINDYLRTRQSIDRLLWPNMSAAEQAKALVGGDVEQRELLHNQLIHIRDRLAQSSIQLASDLVDADKRPERLTGYEIGDRILNYDLSAMSVGRSEYITAVDLTNRAANELVNIIFGIVDGVNGAVNHLHEGNKADAVESLSRMLEELENLESLRAVFLEEVPHLRANKASVDALAGTYGVKVTEVEISNVLRTHLSQIEWRLDLHGQSLRHIHDRAVHAFDKIQSGLSLTQAEWANTLEEMDRINHEERIAMEKQWKSAVTSAKALSQLVTFYVVALRSDAAFKKDQGVTQERLREWFRIENALAIFAHHELPRMEAYSLKVYMLLMSNESKFISTDMIGTVLEELTRGRQGPYSDTLRAGVSQVSQYLLTLSSDMSLEGAGRAHQLIGEVRGSLLKVEQSRSQSPQLIRSCRVIFTL